MPKSKRLQKKIEKKLDQLQELLGKIHEATVINSDDPNTWDSDTLYDLIEKCKEVIKLLQDQESPKLRDDFGNPLILEEGICTLVDEYYSEEEEDEDY